MRYAIGDIHGCREQLEAALRWCAEDCAVRGSKGTVFLLGDYVDRGPDSAGVLELIANGPSQGWMSWKPLRGNHDDMFLRLLKNPSDLCATAWWEHGGQQTLKSYGWDPLRDPVPARLTDYVPEHHIEFLQGLPLYHDDGDVLFVHAGIRPGVPLKEQSPRDLMWIRAEFTKADHGLDRLVVHGHTPIRVSEMGVNAQRLNLDGGCFMGGPLAVAALESGVAEPSIMLFSNHKQPLLLASPRVAAIEPTAHP